MPKIETIRLSLPTDPSHDEYEPHILYRLHHKYCVTTLVDINEYTCISAGVDIDKLKTKIEELLNSML